MRTRPVARQTRIWPWRRLLLAMGAATSQVPETCAKGLTHKNAGSHWPRIFVNCSRKVDVAEVHPNVRCESGLASFAGLWRGDRRARNAGAMPSPINVLVLCPGGLEYGGGIGRQMGYFLAALPTRRRGQRIASSIRVGRGS